VTAIQTPRKKNRTATAIRFPDQLHEQLRETAEQYDFSINYLVVKAVEDFLPRMVPVEELKLTR
jgi:predicted HicB family RNase H-like nuclease